MSAPDKTEANGLPPGWKLVAVNAGFDDLMYWLNRCDEKGHLENCSDLIEPWAAFDYRLLTSAPQEEPKSAAPELLEALEGIVESVDAGTSAVLGHLVWSARAAIAKAGGAA